MYTIGIFLFHDVEVLDFAGPFEVFSVTSELNDHSLCTVCTISQDGRSVTAVNGLKVIPDFSFDNHPPIDILIIPGGVGSKKEMDDPKVQQWVKDCYGKSRMTFSVCSGARILGKIGLLNGIEAVTHHEVIDELKRIAPEALIRKNERFVQSGKIATSGGIAAGIDLSLHIVEQLFGSEIRKRTQIYMEYGDWRNMIDSSK